MLDDCDGITVVDAFTVPRFNYDTQRRVFHENTTTLPSINAEAESKIELYRERYLLLQQRILRHRMFVKPTFNCGAAIDRNYCELTPLTGLLGNANETRYVMGCLSQLEDDRYFLEDLTGQIQVDVSHAATSSGLYTENCIVVAEGEVRKDGVFEVRALGFPPAETREDTRNATNYADFFGAGRLRPSDIQRLTEEEAASTSDMFVVMSDVWLDKESTFTRLRAVFEGFDSLDVIPSMFVLMGDFTSTPFGPTHYDFAGYTRGFDQLAALVEDFPRLRQEARWVLVPGPGDPGVSAALPRPALRPSLTGRLRETLPRATFASNPARVRFRSQDLVFLREDLQSRMRRNCILPPAELEESAAAARQRERKEARAAAGAAGSGASEVDEASAGRRDADMENVGAEDEEAEDEEEVGEWERRPLFRHLAATLVQQAHLCPLPISQLPVITHPEL
jgi:DNA polymerase epsilon subunit 2